MFGIIVTVLLVVAAFMSALAAWKANEIAKRIELHNTRMNKPDISIIDTQVDRSEIAAHVLRFAFFIKNLGREPCDIRMMVWKIYDIKSRYLKESTSRPTLRLKYDTPSTHTIKYELLEDVSESDLIEQGLIILLTIFYREVHQKKKGSEAFVYKYTGKDFLLSFTHEDYLEYGGQMHEVFRKELEEHFGFGKESV